MNRLPRAVRYAVASLLFAAWLLGIGTVFYSMSGGSFTALAFAGGGFVLIGAIVAWWYAASRAQGLR